MKWLALALFTLSAAANDGPWYGFAPLQGANALPADAGAEGVPDWPWLDHWRVGETNITLEEGTGIAYLAGLYHERPDRKEKATPIPTGTVFTAETTLESPVERELAFGAGVDGRLTVWINDDQVATGPAVMDPQSEEAVLRFSARVRAGTNTVRVRCEPNGVRAKFWVRVRVRSGTAQSEAVAGPPVFGYRRDGSGRFPDATPPTGSNVVWRTPLLWGKAQPVIAGDRIFVTEEPQWLTCLDRGSGRILWRREADVFEFTNAEVRAAAAVVRETKPHGEWIEHVRVAGNCVMPLAYKNNGGPNGPWTGFAFGTPVTDGKRIWVRFFTGVIACYDLDGNRQWMVRHEPVQSSGSECTSPVLVDGKVVVQFLHKQPHNLWMRMDKVWLLALDAATGKELWRTDAKDFRSNSTPAVMRLRRGAERLTVLVTGSGTIVRGDDGKMLVPRLPGNDGWGSPVVVDDVVYRFGEGPSSATRLIMVDRDHVGAQRLWAVHTPDEHAGGVVYHDGHLYGLEGSERCRGYRVYDAKTGRRVETPAVTGVGVFRNEAVWTPPAFAGGYIFFCSRGSSSWREAGTGSYISVMEASPDGKFVAHLQLDGQLDTPPVFDGKRLFLRTNTGLVCLGE